MLSAALVCSVIANMMHNGGGLDPAIAPALLFVALNWWRPSRALRIASAIAVALPAALFFRWSALTDPLSTRPFVNHLALLLAASFGAVSAAIDAFSLRARA